MRLKTIFESLEIVEAVITVPDIPNTMSFWHGGNLDDYDDNIAQKNGRYEFGPGLYIINHYGSAKKYAKGGRKMYVITVELGNDINNARLDLDAINEFVDSYVIGSKRKGIKQKLSEYAKDGKVKAYLFNNMMVNEKAVKPSNTKAWREFLVGQGIDYEIVNNPFGWGEKMMVLYNMKKIKKVQQIGPKDKIEDYDMLMESASIPKLSDESADFVSKFTMSSSNKVNVNNNIKLELSKTVLNKPYKLYRGLGLIRQRIDPKLISQINSLKEGDDVPSYLFRDDYYSSKYASWTKKLSVAKQYSEGGISIVIAADTDHNQILADLEFLDQNFDLSGTEIEDDVAYYKKDKEVIVEEPVKAKILSIKGKL